MELTSSSSSLTVLTLIICPSPSSRCCIVLLTIGFHILSILGISCFSAMHLSPVRRRGINSIGTSSLKQLCDRSISSSSDTFHVSSTAHEIISLNSKHLSLRWRRRGRKVSLLLRRLRSYKQSTEETVRFWMPTMRLLSRFS